MDRGEVCSRFLDTVSYELYPFQEEALLTWFESDGGLLVTAPTGMGKTLIAEAAIFEALSTGQRLYYTTPLIALTDQKFREFQGQAEKWGFSRDRIGLVTGNRRVNPDAPVRIVVAEILLNHLIGEEERLDDVCGVVMDEFHYFNDWDRGVVWELSLSLLPLHIRLMLLSATVGNPVECLGWIRKEHGRALQLVRTDERRVPLEFIWVDARLLTEHLGDMVAAEDADNRTPALVFCFNRDECWDVAERLKGLKLIDPAARAAIESHLDNAGFSSAAGHKLRQMLIRGVAVHHAGILPRYKQLVEELFLRKLIPFVICTETLAAGINLPARSVVLTTLMKGKRGEKKLVAPANAHQMFGRAGRPQFDTNGYVYVLAHDDDLKIARWRKKYEQIDPKSKDPNLLRARKQLERKRPTRRKTEQYWTEGQFRKLIEAKPANLASRSMIPYSVLIYLLTSTGALAEVRALLSKRFNTPDRLEGFQKQLDHMIENLSGFGYLTRTDGDDGVTLSGNIQELLNFRSIDPLFGAFLARTLSGVSLDEKLHVLESALQLPPAIERKIRAEEKEPGSFQLEVVEPELLKRGLIIAKPDGGIRLVVDDAPIDYLMDDEEPPPPSLPQLITLWFEAQLRSPDPVFVQPKSVAGGILQHAGDFAKFVRARDLVKNEGLVLRHLLRLTILTGEFLTQSDGDPDYKQIGELATKMCHQVDPSYTDRFLASEEEAKKLGPM